MKNKTICLIAGMILFTVFATTGYANIIDETHGVGAGSFELGNYSGGSFVHITPGSTTITGWTVGGPGDGIDWLITPNFAASDGIHAIDLQHLTNSSMSTVIPTITGATYEITFDATSVLHQGSTALDGIVSAGSLVNQAFTTTATGTFSTQVYLPFLFQFTATNASTTLTFQGVSSPNAYGPVIDNVVVLEVSPAVPEPSTYLLSILALGLLAARRKS